ncbi:MAG: helix-turn-helix domain-containing protein [Lachnospiraceae bacterium]|nr:helix-turn-helix domain-containing protein [Lachnospiraceae bacterium]
MELVFNGKKNDVERTGKTFEFGSLPIVLEQKMVRSEINHEELLHWHDDVELIRIRKGNIHCHVNDSDFLLSPGELCFINFDTLHRVYNTEETLGDLDVLTIKTDMLAHNKEIYEKYIIPIIHNPDFAHVQMDGRNSYAKLISDIFDALYDLITNKPVGYELDVIGYIYMIFRRLYLVYIAQEDIPIPFNGDISMQRRMTAFIYEHYKEKITLDDIAGAAGVSRSKCASLFRTYTQKTPINFLNSYRLEMGSKLLTSTDQPISYIANDCGIGEQSYFNRMFSKEFGCTPLEWRKRGGK